jgi:hypothetical protein
LQKRIGEVANTQPDITLHQQGIATATPGGKTVFQTLEAFAEFDAQ